MAIYRFTLDGNLLADEPIGWQDFISELRRDKEIRGQLLLTDITLFFKKGTDGYAHLKPLIDCQGFCSESEILIDEDCNEDGNWVQIVDGLIIYTLVKEYLSTCILECKLKDNSYSAKIDNNKNVEAYVTVGRSKSDETIIVADSDIVQFFDVVTGNYTGTVKIWPVYGCFKFILHYMTDGEIDFVSDYFFGNLVSGDGRFMCITTGEQIRLGSGGAPTIVPFISFQKLFEEVNKKVPIGFTIETNVVSGRKQMRIEPQSYFFQTGTSTTLNDVKGIIKSVNTAELYSRLKIGSSDTLPFVAGQTDFPNDVAFVGTKEESYTMTGKCNIDNTLDLVSEWIIDTNIIQSVFSNGDSGYDENIFFVMVDYIVADQAIQYDVFASAPPIFYNGFLRNSEVAARWFGGIPNSIALYLGPPTASDFQASITGFGMASNNIAVSPAFEPIIFNNDFTPPNFDSGGNYSTITFEYNAPTSGYFTFFSRLIGTFMIENFDNQLGATVTLNGFINRYDAAGYAGGNLLSSNQIFSYSQFVQRLIYFPYNLEGSAFINVNANDKIVVSLQVLPLVTSLYNVDATVDVGSIFGCTDSITSGGVFQTYNPEDFKAYQYNFDYPLTFADFQTIVANPLKLLAFNDGTNDFSGWIENMKYKHKEGTASFVLTKSLFKTICE